MKSTTSEPGLRVLHANRASERKNRPYFQRLSPISLSVFSLVPHLLFGCLRVLEYAKIRTVLQSKPIDTFNDPGRYLKSKIKGMYVLFSVIN